MNMVIVDTKAYAVGKSPDQHDERGTKLRDLHFFDVNWNTLAQKKKIMHTYVYSYVPCLPQDSRRGATKVEDPYCEFDVNRTEGSRLPNCSDRY